MTPTNASEEAREMARLLRSAGLQAMAARIEAVDRHPDHVDALITAGGAWMKLMNDAAEMLEALVAFAKPSPDTVSGEVERGYAAGIEAAAKVADDLASTAASIQAAFELYGGEASTKAIQREAATAIAAAIRSLASPDALEG